MAKGISAVIDRELTHAELAELKVPRGTKSPAIKSLSDRHHALARLLAEGIKPASAGMMTGYTDSRISILKQDPTFQALVNFYREKIDEQFLDMQAKLAQLAGTAATITLDRLEDNPDAFSTDELASLIKLGADRTGHGPSSTTNVDVNGGLGARLDAAQNRLKAYRAQQADVIDVTPVEEEK